VGEAMNKDLLEEKYRALTKQRAQGEVRVQKQQAALDDRTKDLARATELWRAEKNSDIVSLAEYATASRVRDALRDIVSQCRVEMVKTIVKLARVKAVMREVSSQLGALATAKPVPPPPARKAIMGVVIEFTKE